MIVDVAIPRIGESLQTVFIARWLKKPGERVETGQGLLAIDSDKASMEVPSPVSGVVTQHLAAEGEEVAIGAVVARVDDAQQNAPSAPTPVVQTPVEGGVRAGPAARQLAHSEGVSLENVDGTGKHGRVTTGDVKKALEAEQKPPAPLVAPPAVPVKAPVKSEILSAERVERVPMSPLRRTIARRLVEAQQTAAMLTTFNEIDMTGAMELRKRYQDDFTKKYGIKLGFMSFFLKASIEALKEFPAVNAEISGNDILYKKYYNLGVAVSGPKGLVVPVVRDADKLSFAQTELAIAELSKKAKENKLALADFEDGTFTVSNGGVFGSLMSTPILNPPQVGILGMHNIVERPVGVAGQVVLRPMMYVALSYDHRIIDGREAVSFLVRIKQCVEAPERILLEV